MKQEALDNLQQHLQEQCSEATPSAEAVQLAEQLLSSGTSAETLLALLLQEQITAATKNLPTFDIQSLSAKDGTAVPRQSRCISMWDAKNVWLPILPWCSGRSNWSLRFRVW